MNTIKSFSFISFGIIMFLILMVMGINDYEINLFENISASIDVRILVMFVLAEPHFAMTIPLLIGYKKKFNIDPKNFIIIPILIIIVSAILFYYNLLIFSIIFLLLNIFHVNRQSRGLFILQTGLKKNIGETYEWCLHFSVVIFFTLKFSNFYKENLIVPVLIFMLIGSVYFFFKLNGVQSIRKRDMLVYLQGFLIFLPVVIFDDLLMALAVGISIHYLQYLYISWPVCRKSFNFSAMYLLIFLFIYAVLSTTALSGFITNNKSSLFILIPTTLQLLHFYYDGLIWKRSDPFINNTLIKAD